MNLSPAQVEQLAHWSTDFPDYAEQNLKIINKDSEIVPFKLNNAQKHVWTYIDADLKAGRPIRQYLLKARQMGFSTLIQGIQYWKVSTTMNYGGLTVSHNLESVKKMFLKPKVFYGKSPQWIRPARKISNRTELFFGKDDDSGQDLGLQSSLLITSVKDEHLAASMTLNFLHLSEFARYEAIREDIKPTLVSVLQTVPKRPDTFVFLETTAYGLGFAKEWWDNENNGYQNIFVSWLADPEYTCDVPLLLDELEDIPDGTFQDERAALELVKGELREWYPVQSNDNEWVDHEALCRMRWRREMIETQLLGDAKQFNQEYPLTPLEAFITTGQNVFDTAKLSDIRQAITADPVQPETFRWNRKEREFVPARHGDIRVYKQAEEGQRYVIGADVSEGLREGDYSAAVVVSVPDFEEVCTYRGKVSPDDYADLLYQLGQDYNTAFLCVEVNGPGIATNLRLGNRLHYPRLYWRESFDTHTKKYTRRFGWNTNKATKNVAISDLRGFIDNDTGRFNDVDCIDELMYYVNRDGRMEASTGHHDDRVMAWAMAIQMIHNQGLMTWRPEVETDELDWKQAPDNSMFGLFRRYNLGDQDQWT